ncbi:MAG TPA: hypothetical protein VGA62_07910 [Acidimicrobiia bacterium]
MTYELVTTPEQAEQARFQGSLSILLKGRTLFVHPEHPVGPWCRIYRSPAGGERASTVEQLRSCLGPCSLRVAARRRGRLVHRPER